MHTIYETHPFFSVLRSFQIKYILPYLSVLWPADVALLTASYACELNWRRQEFNQPDILVNGHDIADCHAILNRLVNWHVVLLINFYNLNLDKPMSLRDVAECQDN